MAERAHWPSVSEFSGRVPKRQKTDCFVVDSKTVAKPHEEDQSRFPFLTRPHLKCQINLIREDSYYGYRCSLCDWSSVSERDVMVHIRGHFFHPPFSCKHCHRSFNSLCDLEIHADRRHRQSKICEMCGDWFSHKADLKGHLERDHLIRVSNSFRRNCIVCEEEFFTPAGMEEHVNVAHPGSGQFPCKICNMRFFDNDSRLTHVLFTHQGYTVEEMVRANGDLI